MIPIVTPAEMREIDSGALDPIEVLIERAGSAVARSALAMLGGAYGRTVVVVVGKGNNGNDGRVAARRLAERGVRVLMLDAAELPSRLPPCDLLIDAGYGTGFRGRWNPPAVHAPVLAVDTPTGLDGLTGERGESSPWRANRTVTFAALKPGLMLGDGPALSGTVEVADIGLDVGSRSVFAVSSDAVARWLPTRSAVAHKWSNAVCVIAGSPGMTGAAQLVAAAAQRAGAGMVRLGTPGALESPAWPIEAVGAALPASGWASSALTATVRCHALVIGPGLSRGNDMLASVRHVLAECPLPAVVDADGLFALGWGSDGIDGVMSRREAATVLTPHDGEFANLMGAPPGGDRFAAARALALRTRAVVLLKGPTTIVAEPEGESFAIRSGDERLATAGSGDVLAGIIGAFLAAHRSSTHSVARTVAAAAFVHGRASALGPQRGLVAHDLVDLIPAALAGCEIAP